MSIEEGQVEEGQVEDTGSDDDFLAGIDSSTETPSQQEPVKEETQPEPQAEPAAPVVEETAAPEFVQITKADWEAMQTRAAAIDELKAAQEKLAGTAFGKIGDLQRQIKESGSRSGPVKISEEDFAELMADYPELAGAQLKGLQRAMDRLNAGINAPIDEDAIDRRLNERLESTRQEMVYETLETVVPGWKQDVATPDFMGWVEKQPGWKPQYADARYTDLIRKDPDSELSKLIKANPTSTVARYFSSRPSDAAALVGDFRKDKSAAVAPAKVIAPSARKQQLAAAATPKSSGARAPTRTEDDDFLAGINSRR